MVIHYFIILIVMMTLFIGVQVFMAIYYSPTRVIARWEKKEAERSRLRAMKAMKELQQYQDKKS